MSISPGLVIQLSTALNLPDGTDEENLAQSITSLLKLAISSSNNNSNDTRAPLLSKIAHEILQVTTASGATAASLLDPLEVLPVLLPYKDSSAGEILSLMGESSSAKEVVMAVQEALERLVASLDLDDDDEEAEGDNTADSGAARTRSSLSSQLTTLVGLYSACIPRVKLRQKTPSKTLGPLLTELESAIRHVGSRSSRDEGRALMSAVAQLVLRLEVWSRPIAEGDADVDEGKGQFHSLLDCAVICNEQCIKSSLAQRTFEALFPKYTTRTAVEHGWEGGEEVMSNINNAYSSIGIPTTYIFSKPSPSSMIVFAHSEPHTISHIQLEKLVPVLIDAIKTNSALDEALAILLRTLGPHQTLPRPYLTEEIIYPLFSTLSALSSSHPDSLVRHQAFRILSVLLSMCPLPIRMHLLGELSVDRDFPQMRVAAVGLVKEAVLEGLATVSPSPHLFASPAFFDFFGSILFRLSPEDLLSGSKFSLKEFKESLEPARLVECLGTYYTILQRDQTNLTGMRDTNALKRVEVALLTPLRQVLDQWADEPELMTITAHDRLLLGSLQISLERVDGAISGIKAKR